MAKVTGIGGIFFKSPDPDKLRKWYVQNLGIPAEDGPGVTFRREAQMDDAYIVWGPFKSDTQYFDPADKQYMFNLTVDDLDGALRQVAAAGAEVVGEIEEYDFGRFGWFMDPDGNKVELWEPHAE